MVPFVSSSDQIPFFNSSGQVFSLPLLVLIKSLCLLVHGFRGLVVVGLFRLAVQAFGGKVVELFRAF
jgi:hypothetical protein